MADGLHFTGFDTMARRIREYRNKVIWAIKQVALYWAAVLETYSKENAPWTDQTGNARQSLHAYVEELANDTVKLYLSHGVSYGLYLEVKHAGRWGIVWTTIERHLPEIRAMLQRIFR